jgi:hypothetical protein
MNGASVGPNSKYRKVAMFNVLDVKECVRVMHFVMIFVTSLMNIGQLFVVYLLVHLTNFTNCIHY